MPLESATYIHDLVPANPADTDGMDEAGAQMRLIKSVLQATFPNLTGPVTGTAASLNASSDQNANTGVLEVQPNGTANGGRLKLDPVPGSGSVFVDNFGSSGDPGLFRVVCRDTTDTTPTVTMTVDGAGNLVTPSSISSAAILINGSPLIPRGCILMWAGAANAIPAGWALCNGTNGTPNLQNAFIVGAGLAYAVGQVGGAPGVNTTTDTQGAHSHSGATGSGGGATPTGVTDTQGAHAHTGATGGYSLQVGDLAPHTHNVEIISGPGSDGSFIGAGGGFGGNYVTSSVGSGTPHAHSISTDGAHAHNLSITAIPAHAHVIVVDGSHAHNISVPTLPPFYALCYIMKL